MKTSWRGALAVAAGAILFQAAGCGGAGTTGAAHTYAVSGTISGAVTDGVTVTLAGPSSGTSMTAAGGHYAFPGLANGVYTLTPWLPGFVFSPASLTITVSGGDVADGDFGAASDMRALYRISGVVSGDVASGVTVGLAGPSAAVAVTDSSGNYGFSALVSGVYVVTPSRPGYGLTPVSFTVTVAGADVAGVDFAAAAKPKHTISGTISGLPPRCPGGGFPCGPGAFVGVVGTIGTDIGGTIVPVDDAGGFSVGGLVEGNSVTLIPNLGSRTFTPASREVTISTTDVTGQDFVATAPP